MSPAISGEARLGEAVDADHDLFAAFDRLEAARVRFDQRLLRSPESIAAHRAAHRLDRRDLGLGLRLQRLDPRLDLPAAVKDVAEFEQVGLVRHDLLQAQRPLLIERARQTERLIPCRQLHRPCARALREHDRKHLDEDAIGVVLRLLLGQARAN